MSDNLAAAIDLIVRDGLGGTIEAVPLRMGGTPTITGHRFKVSQVLAEIANEAAINAFCDNFCTFHEPSERAKIHEFFRSLANAFDVTIAKQPPLTTDQPQPLKAAQLPDPHNLHQLTEETIQHRLAEIALEIRELKRQLAKLPKPPH